MFSSEQIAALNAPLDRKHVKSRSQAGRSLSYVEGWHAIEEANRIFGFDGWDRHTMEMKEVCEAYQNEKGNWKVCYRARVFVQVNSGDRQIIREGTGYGSGIDRDLGSAHESAIKEAETDAMKRALMTFGNPFGLALYDKDQANVVDTPREPATKVTSISERARAKGPAPIEGHVTITSGIPQFSEAEMAHVTLFETALEMCQSYEELDDLWRKNGDGRQDVGILTRGAPAYAYLVELCRKRKVKIAEEVGANLRAG